MIDLRSDTATRPTDGMRAAIAAAAVGDEQKREDPTVNELEARGAALLGQESALYLPTATMANQIALRVLAPTGTVVLASLADRAHTPLSVLGTSVFLCFLCYFVFIRQLDIRVPLWPTIF